MLHNNLNTGLVAESPLSVFASAICPIYWRSVCHCLLQENTGDKKTPISAFIMKNVIIFCLDKACISFFICFESLSLITMLIYAFIKNQLKNRRKSVYFIMVRPVLKKKKFPGL